MYRQRYYDNWLDRLWNDTEYRIKVTGIIFIVAMIFISIYAVITYRKVVHAQVIDTTWELKIDQLQYTTLQESDWSIPNGGRLDHKNWEYHYSYYYKSGSHWETKSGGTYSCGTKTCKNPDKRVEVDDYSPRQVYDYKYYYYIDRWINIAPLITSGKNKEDVHWPNTTDHTYNDSDIIGNVKLGTRYSHFQITVAANNQAYSIDMIEPMWRTYTIGTKATLTLGFFNNVIAIEQKGW